MLPSLGRLPTSTKPPKFRPSRHPFRRSDIYPSRVRPERRATFRMPSDETLRITLVCMLPLLHFSHFRVAVPSSSAPAFGAFAPGPSCHLTDPLPSGLDDASSPVVSVGSERFSGMIATPTSFTSAYTIARPSRSAARMPSYSRASRFLPVAGPLEFPREVLTSRFRLGLRALSYYLEHDSSIYRGRCTLCVLLRRSADRRGLRSRLRSNPRRLRCVPVTALYTLRMVHPALLGHRGVARQRAFRCPGAGRTPRSTASGGASGLPRSPFPLAGSELSCRACLSLTR
jgi:hypothetical protein